MLVRLKSYITGSRNGEEWPLPGGVLDVPDHEAADLIHNGYAEEATGAELEDTNAAPDSDEQPVGDSDRDASGDGDDNAGTDGESTKPSRGRSK